MTSSSRPPAPPSPRVRPGPQPADDIRSLRRVPLMLGSLMGSGVLLLTLTEPGTSWATVVGIGCLAAGAVGMLAFYVRLERRLRRTSPADDVAGRARRRFLVTYVPVGALGAILLGAREIAPPWVDVVGIVCLLVAAVGLVRNVCQDRRRHRDSAQPPRTGQIH